MASYLSGLSRFLMLQPDRAQKKLWGRPCKSNVLDFRRQGMPPAMHDTTGIDTSAEAMSSPTMIVMSEAVASAVFSRTNQKVVWNRQQKRMSAPRLYLIHGKEGSRCRPVSRLLNRGAGHDGYSLSVRLVRRCEGLRMRPAPL
jgi:hypothetical protein